MARQKRKTSSRGTRSRRRAVARRVSEEEPHEALAAHDELRRQGIAVRAVPLDAAARSGVGAVAGVAAAGADDLAVKLGHPLAAAVADVHPLAAGRAPAGGVDAVAGNASIHGARVARPRPEVNLRLHWLP